MYSTSDQIRSLLMDSSILHIAIRSDQKLVTIASLHDQILSSDTENIGVDVIVKLQNGGTYTAAFFQYEELMKEVRLPNSGYAPNNQKYFWKKNMVMVNDFQSDTIEGIIHQLMEEGDFEQAFEKIG